jgi:hypothetical protein
MKHIYPTTALVLLALSLCFAAIGVRPVAHASNGNAVASQK